MRGTTTRSTLERLRPLGGIGVGGGEIGIFALGSIRDSLKVGHFRDHKPNICAPNFGRIGNGVPIEYCGQETHFWTPLIKLYAMVQSFFFGRRFLMILSIF